MSEGNIKPMFQRNRFKRIQMMKVKRRRQKKCLINEYYLDNVQSREDIIWDANGGLTEKQIEQYLIVAR